MSNNTCKTKAVLIITTSDMQAEIQTQNLHSHQTGRQRQIHKHTHTDVVTLIQIRAVEGFSCYADQ